MVEVSGLSIAVDGRMLCSDLNFKLPQGYIMAILGPNGRGKTTLLRTLLNLHPAGAGSVRLNAHAAYVPQQNDSLFSYDVLTMVTLGRSRHLRWYQSPSQRDIDIARDCLAMLRIGHLAEKSFNALSGGEKQLVTMARALASASPILILDEPASALDLGNQNVVLSALRSLAAERSMTIVFTTHHPQHAQYAADYTLLLHEGAENTFGVTSAVCTDDDLSRLYGLPVRVTSLSQQDRQVDCAIPIFG